MRCDNPDQKSANSMKQDDQQVRFLRSGSVCKNSYSMFRSIDVESFLVSAPLRGRALFHFLSLCQLLVLDVVCLGWGGWGGGW